MGRKKEKEGKEEGEKESEVLKHEMFGTIVSVITHRFL